MIEMSEHEMVDRCQAGDPAAFRLLVHRHRVLVHAVCLRVTRHDVDAEDAAQETFRAAWRSIRRFDRRSALSTWLYRIAHNEALDVVARGRRCPVPLAELPDRADRRVVDSQVLDRAVLRDALDRLAPNFRAAVILRDVHGMSYLEIADELQVKVDTVKTRICRGRRLLRAMLERQPTP